jgi:hypothetical protein
LNITLKLRGAPLPAGTVPRVLQARTQTRATGLVDDDPFLPRGLIEVDQAVDLSMTARSTGTGHLERVVPTQVGQVLVLEMPDGVTVFTSPEKLKDVLARIDATALDAEGNLVLRRALRGRSVAARGIGDLLGDGLEGLVGRVFTLHIGRKTDAIIEDAKKKLAELLGKNLGKKLDQQLGVSWLGTKALMRAIEDRLERKPGVYRWSNGALTDQMEANDARLKEEAKEGPLLIFIHGTASNTAGSFSDLQSGIGADWQLLEERYGERIYALEHHTLSASPIENALQLVAVLPKDAQVHLVTHSRGGLVGDLLCLQSFDALIDKYALDEMALGEADPTERTRVIAELQAAHEEQRQTLRQLSDALGKKKLRIERYVRVACPARGTRLVSANFDVFLSGLLSLIGAIPMLSGNPLYSAFKRAVLEIVKNRTRPNLVPGIEAMLPESPLGRFLACATPQPDTQLALIAGDIEGGGLLKRLGVLFTDFMFFDSNDNDLVVDTDSMYGGIARAGQTRMLFDRGTDVSHFNYFRNDLTRTALHSFLLAQDTTAVEPFEALPPTGTDLAPALETQLQPTAHSRAVDAVSQSSPVVIVLPDIMGSHLRVGQQDRVWFDLAKLARGGLAEISWGRTDIAAQGLFEQHYGAFCNYLLQQHRVERFPYDWRQPLDVLAEAFAQRVRELLDSTGTTQPIRILAHGTGGLVVRGLIHKEPALWDQLMARAGAHFVMLGTPNQGSYRMVESLLGKADNMRALGRLDLEHRLQGVLDIVARFRGALQLLPKVGFVDAGYLQPADAPFPSYFDASVWTRLKSEITDSWFGDGVCSTPPQDALDAAQWLWTQDGPATPSLPLQHQQKVSYVFGIAPKTPCGLRKDGGRWRMIGTPQGDGSVTWASGHIGGISRFFYMPVEHSALLDTQQYFAALLELLEKGTGGNLLIAPPATRDVAQPATQAYDAGPAPYPSQFDAADLFGTPHRVRARPRRKACLRVTVKAMDLRCVTRPILVGHYDEDPISGAEALIDRDLVSGELSVRRNLGMYAGRIGTATAVLLARNAEESRRGSLRGCVVTGLGKYDGTLTPSELTEAVQAAALRYLLHVLDNLHPATSSSDPPEPLRLASLLIGYNSCANLTIADAVGALIRGISAANHKFQLQTRSCLRIEALQIVELYLDTAISAMYAVQRIADIINAEDGAAAMTIEPGQTLERGEGACQRLTDTRGGSYWPRLIASSPAGNSASDRPTTEQAAPLIADRIQFLYLGERARAESQLHERQPRAMEALIARQVAIPTYQPDFSRSMFNLMLPSDLKDMARQLDRLVLVVDGYTANFPWELMVADELPLVTQVAMVRQLASARFRADVHQSMQRTAYVIGNPSSEGFSKVFAHPGQPAVDPLPLPHAETEAAAVADLLMTHGFGVQRAIGADQGWLDVFTKLHREPYRIIHIAAHGIHDLRAVDGRRYSGVVLSDGVLLTAAEFGGMRNVPELVFLNCCHLAKTDAEASSAMPPTEFNKLAYSIARELIEDGVRAVVAAGWAVGDESASLFAETFYTALLSDNQPFGLAVLRARNATWQRFRNDVTWGAFQAYGDPDWRVNPLGIQSAALFSTQWQPVAPEELLAKITALRFGIRQMDKTLSRQEVKRKQSEVEKLHQLAAPEWRERPDILCAIAALHADLGPECYAKACGYYEQAIAAQDELGLLPVKAIEQLANLEARRGEYAGQHALIDRAIERLEQLERLTASSQPVAINKERNALLASAYKSKAAVLAREIIAQPTDGSANRKEFVAVLNRATEIYGRAASKPTDREVEPYSTLNWLALLSVTLPAEKAAKRSPKETTTKTSAKTNEYADLAQRCADAAHEAFKGSPDFWSAIMAAEAHLVKALLNRSLSQTDAAAEGGFDAVRLEYQLAREGVLCRPIELDSVVRQLHLLALFFDASAVVQHDHSLQPIAACLRTIAEFQRPGAVSRGTLAKAPHVSAAASEEGAEAARATLHPRQGARTKTPSNDLPTRRAH